MITHLTPLKPWVKARPFYRSAIAESLYNSKIIRCTGNSGSFIPVIGGSWHGPWSRHRYSKRQPWNHDGTKILIDQKGGNPARLVLADVTPFGTPLFGSNDGNGRGDKMRSGELQWRPGPGHETQMVRTKVVSGGLEVEVFDIATTAGTRVGIMTIPIINPSTETGDPFGWIGEGQISDDGRWTVFTTAYKYPQYEGRIGNAAYKDYIVVADLETFTYGPNCDVSYCTMGDAGLGIPVFDTQKWGTIGNPGISCLGNFAKIHLSGDSADSSSENKPGVASGMQYAFILDIDKNTKVATRRPMDPTALRMGSAAAIGAEGALAGMIAMQSHSDFNIDQAGVEVVVGGGRKWEISNKAANIGTEQGNVISVNCNTGIHTHVSPGRAQAGDKVASMQHGSGRAYGRRGWHVITTEMGGTGLFAGEVQWVKLRTPTGARGIERLGLHRSMEAEGGTKYYGAEAHAVSNPNGTEVMFASNWWGIGGTSVDPKNDCKAYIFY